MIERWLPIPGHPGYEVSSRGGVRSVDRVVLTSNGQRRRYHGQAITPNPCKHGDYPVVTLGRDGKHYVHRLVLEAFVGPCPDGEEARHLNGDQLPDLTGLAWGTRSENTHDRVRHGTHHEVNRETCPQLHPLEPPNLATWKLPTRECLACSRGGRIARTRGELHRWGEYADAYYEEIAGRGVGALIALGVNPWRLLRATGGGSQ